MGFANDIIGGAAALIRAAIKSPNFVHGTSGWSINKDGSAEFRNIVLPAGSGGAIISIGPAQPSSPHTGDLWLNTSNGLEVNQWNGSAWTAYQYGTNAIANAAITNALLAAGAVGTSNVQSAAITNALLAAAAVATSNIQNGAVTTAQINAAAGILGSQLSGSAGITGGQLANGTVTNTQLANTVTARSLGGITTTISTTAPSSPQTGDIWIDEVSAGPPPSYLLKQWNGSAWVSLTANATDAINAATITGSLIAASTITGGNIQAGTITASNIQSGTITTGLIAANAITVGLLATNIVYAGIVNGTTIMGATIVADGTTGQFLVYSGTPASGNLIGAWSGAAGSDSNSNAFIAGLQIGAANNNQILANPNVNQPFDITTAIAGIFEAMFQYTTTDASEMMPSMMGSVLLGSGTATKMSSVFHSPFGTEGCALVLESQNDAGTDTPVITLGTVTMPSGVMVFVPIMTLTPYAMVLYSGSGSQVSVTQTSGSGTIAIPAGVTTVKAECWGASGGGQAGGIAGSAGQCSGGGGEYAAESSLAVTGGGTVSYSVGAAGSGGVGSGSTGGAGGNSTLTGTSVTVTAHGGSGGGPTSGGAGGTGSTNTTHHNGGAGGTSTQLPGGGAGGGGSGGVNAAGFAGADGGGSRGGAGGSEVSGGGAGGHGGTGNTSGNGTPGQAGFAPGGGGGGGGGSAVGFSAQNGGAGSAGQVRITYTNGTPAVGFSINFGAAFNDQFGNSIPAGLNTTAGITTSGGVSVTGGTVTDTLGVRNTATTNALTVNGTATFPDSETWGSSGLASASGLTGKPPIVQADTGTHANANVSGATAISTAWTIPAGDMKLGTVYEIHVPLGITMESQTLQLGLSVDGSTTFTAWDTIGGAIVSAGVGLNGWLKVWVQCTATGASGSITAQVIGAVRQNGTNVLFSNAASIAGHVQTATIDTTISHNIRVNSLWGASATGETVSGFGSKFTRSGP